MRCAIYARCASDLRDGSQAEKQVKDVAQWAANNGHQVDRVYRDAGVSGLRMDGAGIQQLMTDMEDGAVEAVALMSVQRVSRDVTNILKFRAHARTCGVPVLYIEEATAGRMAS